MHMTKPMRYLVFTLEQSPSLANFVSNTMIVDMGKQAEESLVCLTLPVAMQTYGNYIVVNWCMLNLCID